MVNVSQLYFFVLSVLSCEVFSSCSGRFSLLRSRVIVWLYVSFGCLYLSRIFLRCASIVIVLGSWFGGAVFFCIVCCSRWVIVAFARFG